MRTRSLPPRHNAKTYQRRVPRNNFPHLLPSLSTTRSPENPSETRLIIPDYTNRRMRVRVIIDPAHDQYETALCEIQTYLHFQARGYWTISEKEDCDGRTVRTIDFQDLSEMVGHIRETVATESGR